MSMLDRKLLRDLLGLRGQVATIALVVAAGMAVLVMSVSAFLSLRAAMEAHYAESRFAEVFAEAKRAPRPLLGRIAEIPGVAAAEGRVLGDARVVWPAAELPVSARLLSLPAAGGQPALNRLTLVTGRLPDPLRREEAVLHFGFATAWGVQPGDEIPLVLNGRSERFRVVGIVHAPEFVFASRGGSPLPDDRGFAVLWANATPLARAFDMEGAFNQVSLRLAPGAHEEAVIAELDRLLEPWGGRGAHGRRDQPSHRLLEDELTEQRTLAITVPLVFFGVAAFLLNIVLGRLVSAQREQVAALKALGYPSLPIALHYAKLALVVCLLGSALGAAAGAWMGRGLLGLYEPFFRFPAMPYSVPAWLPPLGALAGCAVGLAGVLAALHRVLRLPAAEGLRPPAPAAFGGARLGSLVNGLRPQAKIVLRSMLGRPLRAALTVLGIALAMPMVVLGLFWGDALKAMITLQFDGIERSDAFIAFTDPRPARAVGEIARLPGILQAEGQRIVPVRLRAGNRSHLLGLTGLPEDATLRVPRDAALRPATIPPAGLALSRRLAEKLGVREGDVIRAEVLEGERPVLTLPVAVLVEDIIGLSAFLEIRTLNRLMREADLVSHVAVRIDPLAAPALWPALDARPRVAATGVKVVWLRVFDEVVARMVQTSATFLTGFGIIIAIGVVYNAARVSMQERSWDMASLRVLGFTRAEVARILLAELGIASLLGVMLGVPLAQGLVSLILGARNNESFDLPAAISAGSFVLAAMVVLGAAAVSALLVRRRVDRLDLVAALKARE